MSELRADTFRAALAKDEIRLQFGTAQPADAGESAVALQRSIALTPAIALRLLSRLRDALRESERRAAAAPAAVVSQMGKTLLNAAPEEAGEQAAQLFGLVDGLRVPYRHERSFRLAHQSLQANRVLLSVGRAQLGDAAAGRLLGICERLGLPPAMRGQVEEHWARSRAVHFGFESDGARSLYKVYFERADADDAARRAPAGTPVLLHLAWKWDAALPAHCVTTRYEWIPRLGVAEMRERMARACGAGPLLEAAQSVLELAAARVDPARLQYLEVGEEGNARRSCDLNLYDAGLTVRDAQAPLARLREHFALRAGQYQALYDQVRARTFGHFACGLHRDGAPFATVYYGVERRG